MGGRALDEFNFNVVLEGSFDAVFTVSSVITVKTVRNEHLLYYSRSLF